MFCKYSSWSRLVTECLEFEAITECSRSTWCTVHYDPDAKFLKCIWNLYQSTSEIYRLQNGLTNSKRTHYRHLRKLTEQVRWLVVTEVRSESFGLVTEHVTKTDVILSRAFSALCVYSTFSDVRTSSSPPIGYLCAKFRFRGDLRCWASPWREIAYSINNSLTQLIWCPRNRSFRFGIKFKNAEENWRPSVQRIGPTSAQARNYSLLNMKNQKWPPVGCLKWDQPQNLTITSHKISPNPTRFHENCLKTSRIIQFVNKWRLAKHYLLGEGISMFSVYHSQHTVRWTTLK